jgi:hypothetical protein
MITVTDQYPVVQIVSNPSINFTTEQAEKLQVKIAEFIKDLRCNDPEHQTDKKAGREGEKIYMEGQMVTATEGVYRAQCCSDLIKLLEERMKTFPGYSMRRLKRG